MPTISKEIPETVETVVRPLVVEIARNVLQRTGLDVDQPVFLAKELGGVPVNNAAMRSPNESANFDQAAHLVVSYEEEYHEDATVYTPKSDYPAIFADEALGVWIRPIQCLTEVTISFRQYFDSEAQANNWRNRIRRRIAEERQHSKHTVSYHYPIPDEFMYVLMQLHLLRENRAGYGQTVGQWFKETFVSRVAPMTNQAGTVSRFSVKEQQTGMNGWFDFTDLPKLQQNTTKWSAEFTYVVRYEKPISMGMQYPLMIHNQLVPDGLRIRGENYNVLVDPGYGNAQKTRYDRMMSTGTILPGESISGISIPEFDEWLPGYTRSYYSTLMRLMPALSESNLRTLGCLGTLGEWSIDETILNFMYKYHDDLTVSGRNPIHVALYVNDEIMAEDAITIDETLTVHASHDLSLRKRYHVWVGLSYDLFVLDENAVPRFLEDANVVKKVIGVIDDRYPVETIPVMDDGSVAVVHWNSLKDELRHVSKRFRDGVEVNCMTVGNFTVSANRNGA